MSPLPFSISAPPRPRDPQGYLSLTQHSPLTARPAGAPQSHLTIIGTRHRRILRPLIEAVVVPALTQLAMLYGQIITRFDRELSRIGELLLLGRTAHPHELLPGHLLHLGRENHTAGPRAGAFLLVAVGGPLGRAGGDFGRDAGGHDGAEVEVRADADGDADFVGVFFAEKAGWAAVVAVSGRAHSGFVFGALLDLLSPL